MILWNDDGKRLPLAEGRAVWMPRLALAATAAGDRYALIEYVADDRPEHFLDDARELLAWLVKDA